MTQLKNQVQCINKLNPCNTIAIAYFSKRILIQVVMRVFYVVWKFLNIFLWEIFRYVHLLITMIVKSDRESWTQKCMCVFRSKNSKGAACNVITRLSLAHCQNQQMETFRLSCPLEYGNPLDKSRIWWSLRKMFLIWISKLAFRWKGYSFWCFLRATCALKNDSINVE